MSYLILTTKQSTCKRRKKGKVAHSKMSLSSHAEYDFGRVERQSNQGNGKVLVANVKQPDEFDIT